MWLVCLHVQHMCGWAYRWVCQFHHWNWCGEVTCFIRNGLNWWATENSTPKCFNSWWFMSTHTISFIISPLLINSPYHSQQWHTDFHIFWYFTETYKIQMDSDYMECIRSLHTGRSEFIVTQVLDWKKKSKCVLHWSILKTWNHVSLHWTTKSKLRQF